jgi:hypothetical protein
VKRIALLAACAPLGLASAAAADTLGGFSAVDSSTYLVNADRVCTAVAVDAATATATGGPTCRKAPSNDIAGLDFHRPVVQSGANATFAASASGRTLTVTHASSGDTVVTWQADDPISRVVEVYASDLGDRVAVAYTSRRGGHEFTDVVAFSILRKTAVAPPTGPTAPTAPTAPTGPTAPAHVDAPDVVAAIAAARKAPPGKALAAWQAVIALDADHSEARFRVAELQATGKTPADAVGTLEDLAKSSRGDAIEWLVEARFDKAFAKLLADARFRTAVGLDRKPATPYERFMGLGGHWEQAGQPCDHAAVVLAALQDRSFKLRVKETCNGQTMDLPFHGTWRIEGDDGITLGLPPNKGQAVTDADEVHCTLAAHGDEDALHCTLGHDLDFTVLPTRR